jgi:hypothetical protein
VSAADRQRRSRARAWHRYTLVAEGLSPAEQSAWRTTFDARDIGEPLTVLSRGGPLVELPVWKGAPQASTGTVMVEAPPWQWDEVVVSYDVTGSRLLAVLVEVDTPRGRRSWMVPVLDWLDRGVAGPVVVARSNGGEPHGEGRVAWLTMIDAACRQVRASAPVRFAAP